MEAADSILISGKLPRPPSRRPRPPARWPGVRVRGPPPMAAAKGAAAAGFGGMEQRSRQCSVMAGAESSYCSMGGHNRDYEGNVNIRLK